MSNDPDYPDDTAPAQVLQLLLPENLPDSESTDIEVREALRIFAQATESNLTMDEMIILLSYAEELLGPELDDAVPAPAPCSGPKNWPIYDDYWPVKRVIGRPDRVLARALIRVVRDLVIDAQSGTHLDPTAWSYFLATTVVISRLISDPNDPPMES
jgi:hypothetical protein